MKPSAPHSTGPCISTANSQARGTLNYKFTPTRGPKQRAKGKGKGQGKGKPGGAKGNGKGGKGKRDRDSQGGLNPGGRRR